RRRAPAAGVDAAERPRLASRKRRILHVEAERRGEGAGAVRGAVGIAARLAVATARGPAVAHSFAARDAPFDEAPAIACPRQRRGETHHQGGVRARGPDLARRWPPSRLPQRRRGARTGDPRATPAPSPRKAYLLASAGQVFWLGDHPRPVPSHPEGQWL